MTRSHRAARRATPPPDDLWADLVLAALAVAVLVLLFLLAT